MRRFLIPLVLVLVLAFIISGCSSGAKATTTTSTTQPTTTQTTTAPPTTTTSSVGSIELSLVNFLPDIPPGNVYVHIFMDLVKKYSNGAMTVKLLGPEAIPAPDAPAAVQRGTVDIASALSNFADSLVPGSSSIGRAEYDPPTIRKGPAFKYYLDAFGKKGIYFGGASFSSKPQAQTVIYLGRVISKLDELKGLKIAATGGSNKAFIDSLGAVTVPIDFTDYFTSMERGTVDGYNIGIPGIQDFSLTPVTKAMIDEPFSSNGGMFLMNMNKYNSLSAAQKDALDRAFVQAEIDCIPAFDQIITKVKDDITKAGVKLIKLSPDESKRYYLAYRDNMWAEDIARWPDIGPQLKSWLVDPNFPRAQ